MHAAMLALVRQILVNLHFRNVKESFTIYLPCNEFVIQLTDSILSRYNDPVDWFLEKSASITRPTRLHYLGRNEGGRK